MQQQKYYIIVRHFKYETNDKTFDFTNLAEAFQSLDHSLGTKNLQLKILFSHTRQLKR